VEFSDPDFCRWGRRRIAKDIMFDPRAVAAIGRAIHVPLSPRLKAWASPPKPNKPEPEPSPDPDPKVSPGQPSDREPIRFIYLNKLSDAQRLLRGKRLHRAIRQIAFPNLDPNTEPSGWSGDTIDRALRDFIQSQKPQN